MIAARSSLLRPTGRAFVCQTCVRTIRRNARRHASTDSKLPEIYDVVCVGGGPAGLSLLAALRASPIASRLKVALVESQDLNRTRGWKLPPNQYSNRVSSLTPASVKFLKDIGAWRHIQRSRVQAYTEMQVWDGVSGSRISFDWPEASSPARHASSNVIAYMTENLNLTSALLARLNELGGVSIFSPTAVEDISLGPETEQYDLRSWPVVRLSDGSQIAARLLVGADGANSPVRQFAGIETRGWDYERMGVVATVQLEGSGWRGEEEKCAYQRFLPTGPVALLPLPNNFSTLVWSTTPSNAALLKSLASEDLTAMINAAFRLSPVDLAYLHTMTSGGQAEEIAWREQHTEGIVTEKIPMRITGVQEGSVAAFPLKMRHADTYTGERVVLVGDAAHSIHPLAGQGLNQGQGDIQALISVLTTALSHGQDIGDQLSLEPYNAARYAENNLLLGVVDKLHKLYSAGSGPVVWARSLGLGAVERLGGVKRLIMGRVGGGS